MQYNIWTIYYIICEESNVSSWNSDIWLLQKSTAFQFFSMIIILQWNLLHIISCHLYEKQFSKCLCKHSDLKPNQSRIQYSESWNIFYNQGSVLNDSPICRWIYMHCSPKSHMQNCKPILILFHPPPIASKQPQIIFLPSESDMRGKCIVDPGSDFGKLLWPCSAYERKQPGTYQVGKAVSFEAGQGDPVLPFIYMRRELLADQVSALQHSRSKNALFFFFF